MAVKRCASRLIRLIVCLATVAVLQAKKLPERVYTVTDGLATNSIDCIFQDSRGFIWFCTSEGLSRFDGYQFRNFSADQGLPERANRLLETSQGEYWVSSASGVYHFAPRISGRLARLYTPETRNEVTELAADGRGGIWCGTDGGGVYHLERTSPGSWRLRSVDIGMPASVLGGKVVDALLVDPDGVLWVGSASGLYRRFPDGRSERYTVRDGLLHDHVLSLLRDRRGTLWAGTWDGLCRISIAPRTPTGLAGKISIAKIGLKARVVFSMLESSDARFWVATSNGLYELLSRGQQEYFAYRETPFGSRDNITALIEDRARNIWAASDSQGVLKMSRQGFVTYGEEDGLPSKNMLSVFEDRQGSLCVLTDSAGDRQPKSVNWFDGQRFHPVRPNLPAAVKMHLGWGWYQYIFQDREGDWWVPTGNGIFRFSRLSDIARLASSRPAALFPPGDPAEHAEAFRAFEDSRGDIWIGTTADGAPRLMRWERATQRVHRYGDMIANRLPTAFAEDRGGNVWIGFSERGVARYRGAHLQLLGPAEGAPDGWIQALYLDSKGRLWMASGRDGLARVDAPESAQPAFVTFTTAQGLSGNHERCITEDRWGRIYVGGSRGVDCFYPLSPLRVRHYTSADGLPHGSLRVAFRDRRGSLWFGTSNGLARFEPGPDQPQPAAPIVINALRVRGERRFISALGEVDVSGIVLNASQNQIQVDFSSPDLHPGAPLRYQYRLESADSDWSAPSEERTVNFATLPPGDYRFLVRALTIDGLASEHPATLAFRILAPYWAQWWYRVLLLMLAAATVYSVYRFQVGRLLEVERLRTRIATDLHDDIGASLSRIAIMSEVLIQRAGPERNGLAGQLDDIAGGAREMLASMSDIVWAINPSHDHLRDLAQRMRRFASDVLSTRDIHFIFRAPADQDLKMDADTRRQLFLVFKEAVNNIARHSGCTHAEIELAREHDAFVLRIRDDGKGMASSAANGGNGLPNMQSRAGTLGGDIAIESRPGRGTSITLRVPVRARPRRENTIQMDGDRHSRSF